MSPKSKDAALKLSAAVCWRLCQDCNLAGTSVSRVLALAGVGPAHFVRCREGRSVLDLSDLLALAHANGQTLEELLTAARQEMEP